MKTIRNIILPVILPVILALILPQVIFGLRDKYLMGSSFADRRQGIDPSYLNVEFVGGTFANKLEWIARQDKLGKNLHLIEVEDDLDEQGRAMVIEELSESYLVTGTMDCLASVIAFYFRYNKAAYDEISQTLNSPEEKQVILNLAEKGKALRDVKNPAAALYDYDFVEILGIPQIYETKWRKYILLNEQDRTALEIRKVTITIYEKPRFVMEFYVDADNNGIYSISISSEDVSAWKGKDNWNYNIATGVQLPNLYSQNVSILEDEITKYYPLGGYTELANGEDSLIYIWEFGTEEDRHTLHYEADYGIVQPGDIIYKMGITELEEFLED